MTNYTAFLIRDEIEKIEGQLAKNNLIMALQNPDVWQWESWDEAQHADFGNHWELNYGLVDLVYDKLASVMCFKTTEGYKLYIFTYERKEDKKVKVLDLF